MTVRQSVLNAHPREGHLMSLPVVVGAEADTPGETLFNDGFLGRRQSALL